MYIPSVSTHSWSKGPARQGLYSCLSFLISYFCRVSWRNGKGKLWRRPMLEALGAGKPQANPVSRPPRVSHAEGFVTLQNSDRRLVYLYNLRDGTKVQ